LKALIPVNLLHHDFYIADGGVRYRIPSSGKVARLEIVTEPIGKLNLSLGSRVLEVPIVEITTDNLVLIDMDGFESELPEEDDEHIYLVSTMVAEHLRGRMDVYAPDTTKNGVVRNERGSIIAVSQLQTFN